MTHRNPIGPRAERLEDRRLLASVGTLLSQDFTNAAWQQSPGALSSGVSASLAQGGYGTIDVEGSTVNSGGLRLTVDAAPAAPWSASLTSGQLAVTNTETNLGKLTLAFSLSASQAKAVRVVVASYDAAGNRTGALQTTIDPAAAYSYQRYALDLSTMTPSGPGTFNPTAPKVSFDLEMGSANGWSSATAAQLRLDNVNYAKPAYYVSATGGNNGGRTEANAFKTPQQALNVAQPGDIILLMNGTYNQVTANTGAIQFQNNSGGPISGTAAAWITVKNYPGQSPVIYNEAWNAIKIGASAATTRAAVAYVEIRGLHVVGDSPKVGSRTAPDGPYDPNAATANQYGVYGQYVNQADPRTNGNGISVDGRYETNKPHDIRIADNVVEDLAGAGIGAGDSDRIQIENNVVRNNCYWDIYATSGISILSAYNFDGTSGSVTRLVRNNVSSGNIHKEKWAQIGKYSDGNGIIIDINRYAADATTGTPARAALGRTLVTNNVTFDNGGSGIHAFTADHIDIVNNVAYLNSASPYLQYGQIFASFANDVRIYNNILVAPVAPAGQTAEPVNGGNKPTTANGIVYSGNIYSGGNTAPYTGTGDTIADPKFVNPSTNPAVADFRLQSSSPAINRGTASLAPQFDLARNPHYGNPDSGVYEFIPAAPTGVALAAASDTGVVGDNKTNLSNAAAASRLTFNVTGTLSGATVSLYSGAVLLGTATATGTTTVVTTDGATALPDGAASITAVQTFAGAPSAASAALGLVVDTAGPTMTAVASRKVHGSAGTFDLPIDLTATGRSSTIEPRIGGGSTLVFTFAKPVRAVDGVLSANEFGLTNAAFASATVSGNTLTLNLADVKERDVLTVTLAGLADDAGNAIVGDADVSVGNLVGDVNQTGSVSVSDQQGVKNNLLATLGVANFLFDVNLSGTVSVSDQQTVKNYLLATLA